MAWVKLLKLLPFHCSYDVNKTFFGKSTHANFLPRIHHFHVKLARWRTSLKLEILFGKFYCIYKHIVCNVTLKIKKTVLLAFFFYILQGEDERIPCLARKGG